MNLRAFLCRFLFLIAIPEVARQLGSSREHFGLSHFLIATGEVNWQLGGADEWLPLLTSICFEYYRNLSELWIENLY